MSLKQNLTDLTAAIADKTNELHTLAEMKANKQQDLTSTNPDHFPSVPAVNAGLDLKVDKDGDKVLSDNNYTDDEKTKLASLESSKYRGTFTSEANLPTTLGSGDPLPEGSYAHVDSGVAGEDAVKWIWDANDAKWIEQVGSSSMMTDAQVKEAYENNADTNAFTDAEKIKLEGLENYDDTALSGRVTTAEGEIDTLQSDVSGLNSRVTTNEGDISTLQSNVSTNAQGVTDLESELTTYYKAIGTAFPDYEAQYLAAVNY